MGLNKPFLEIEGLPIIKRTYALFEGIFDEVIIVTNQEELYSMFNTKISKDLFADAGVAGGLYTGLFFSSFQHSFCVGSDMPFLKEPLIEYLIRNIEGYDVVVPKTKDGLQPLHAVYSKNCIEPIRKMINDRRYRIIDFYKYVRTKIIDEVEFISLDPLRESFVNINTPEEFLNIKQREHHL